MNHIEVDHALIFFYIIAIAISNAILINHALSLELRGNTVTRQLEIYIQTCKKEFKMSLTGANPTVQIPKLRK